MDGELILSVEQAAQLVRATPDTLLRYIRRGELPAARLGKHMIVLYADLVSFIRVVAAQQAAERLASHAHAGTPVHRQAAPAVLPQCLVMEPSGAPRSKRRGRRKELPCLPINDM